MKEERNKTLQQQMTDKYHRFQVVTLLVIDLRNQNRNKCHNVLCYHQCPIIEINKSSNKTSVST